MGGFQVSGDSAGLSAGRVRYEINSSRTDLQKTATNVREGRGGKFRILTFHLTQQRLQHNPRRPVLAANSILIHTETS